MLLQRIRGVCKAAFPISFCVTRHLALTTSKMEPGSSKPDHQSTVANTVVNETKAVVESMADLSPTVKGVTFRVANKALRFMSGQWVDLMVTGVDTVGGFSMSSSPHVLEERQQLDLAIKASSHPPAHWVHTQCRVGSEVTLRVGGNIFYAPPAGTPAHSLLLIAGGVGMNPLYSILQHAVHQRSGTKVTIMCTARTGEELLFREQIEQIAAASSQVIKCQFFVTGQNDKKDTIGVKYGRIGKAEVEEAVRMLQQGGTPVTSYLCGPGSMISTMETYLQQVGLAQSRILYEKW